MTPPNERDIREQERQDAFHAHLDGCSHCRERPMQLCEEGARLLARAAGGRDG